MDISQNWLLQRTHTDTEMCVILSTQAAPLYPKFQSTHFPAVTSYGIQQMFYISLVDGAGPFSIIVCSLFIEPLPRLFVVS